MKRPLRSEELKLWGVVAATIRPSPGRSLPEAASESVREGARVPEPVRRPAGPAAAPVRPARAQKTPAAPPDLIEPGRRRRLIRERDDLGARLDLHGLDQDHARAALHAFLLRAQADGLRAVLVITGKGNLGDGVLKRRAPEWLAEPALRPVVAGVSPAHRRHGGDGALYVAIRRKV